MKRLAIAALVLLLAPTFSWAQGHIANIFNNYDLDDTTFVYCDTANVPALMTACTTGAAANDGWIPVGDHSDKSVGIAIDEVAVTGGVIVTFQVRYQKEDGTYTDYITLMTLIAKDAALTDNQSVRIPDEVSQMRVGIRIGTADDGGDAVEEDIDIIYHGR